MTARFPFLVVVALAVSACAVAPADRVAAAAAPVVPALPTIVVDTALKVPQLTPWSVTLEPRRIRGQVSDVPRALVNQRDIPDDADTDFLLLHDGGSRGHLVVDATVGTVPLALTLDTGATRTVITAALARRLGLSPVGEVPMRDATGRIVRAGEVVLPDVTVGRVRFTNLVALVPPTSLRDDLFLLGLDALAHVDVVYDGPLGAVALRPAGSGLDDVADISDVDIVGLDASERLVVSATAPGAGGAAAFDLVVDTGTPLTVVPAAIGVEARLPADVSRTITLKGQSGLESERRGRFLLSPLSLGLIQLGRVSALETSDEQGLLGNDVLGRSRVVISAARRSLAFVPTTAWGGDRLVDGQRAVRLVPVGAFGEFDVEVAPELVGGVRLLVRAHNASSGAPLGGVLELTPTTARKHVDSGLYFGAGAVSYTVLPRVRTAPPCTDGMCMKLLGDWPASPD